MTQWPERLVLLGHPLGHSLSPVFQNAALRAAGIQATYMAVDVPRSALDDLLAELRRDRAAGNVTIPYKEVVHDACDRLTAVARHVGAVNTFWTAIDGALVGDNTDVDGFAAAAERLIGPPPEGTVVALLGAGGAAAAVMAAIERWHGARVRLYSRTRDRADALARRFSMNTVIVDSVADALRGATLMVNATPIGLRSGESPVDARLLAEDCAVLDLVYRHGGTTLVQSAKQRGLRADDGLTMLIEQGAHAFERWFGMFPDRDVMWNAVASRV